jgi:hypothetical protein
LHFWLLGWNKAAYFDETFALYWLMSGWNGGVAYFYDLI